MAIHDKKISRRKFLGLSTGALAGMMFSPGLSTLVRAGSGPVDPVPAGSRQFIASNCAMCVNKCGIIGEVVDGKLRKINPNKKHLKSRGMLCAKGNAGAALPYSSDRLKTPLLRTGERGEGKWKEISWDEAFKYVARNLADLKKEYKNRSTVAFASTEGFQEEFYYYLVNSFGSLNTVRHPTLCLSSNIQGWSSVFGVYPDADLKNAEFVIMLGSDRAQALITPDSVDFQRYKPKGQKLIVLDPRFTETGAKADRWYPVKPRTDQAFVLAMMHVIINENRYDKTFVETYTHGFEQLREMVQEYTPQWAEGKCEIPAAEIVKTAREFADHAPRSVIYPGRRSSFYTHEVYVRQTYAILAAICGCWDTKGGVVPKSSIDLDAHNIVFPFFMETRERMDKEATNLLKDVVPSAVQCPMIGTGLPTDSCAFLSEKDGSWISFREAVLNDNPYPVRGFVCFKQNPVQAVPNTAKTLEMLKKMEFICVIDQQMSDTAWYADIVLPHTTYLEGWDPAHSLSGIWPVVAFRQPMIEKMFNTKTMFEIAGGVIHEMLKIDSLWDDIDPADLTTFKKDIVEDVLDKPIQDFIRHQVKSHPGGWEQLLKEGFFTTEGGRPRYGYTRKPGFRFKTKTGRIEFFNERYKSAGLFPLPKYCEPEVLPEKGEYRFLVGRTAWNTHTSTQNNPYLWEIQKENALWIHTDEAGKMGIRSGDEVIVKSHIGAQRIKAYVTEKIRPDCLFYVNGWGRHSPWMSRVYKTGASEAEILDDVLDSISGSACMHETFVTVTKA
ncbi:MAG: molybdopterin-dependent oxidoreductase [Thermodesulfobacteriota bacterium]|nr:molybdopterin-dependent oxidoreductase [Thermodesulfobacteriota bacterium]